MRHTKSLGETLQSVLPEVLGSAPIPLDATYAELHAVAEALVRRSKTKTDEKDEHWTRRTIALIRGLLRWVMDDEAYRLKNLSAVKLAEEQLRTATRAPNPDLQSILSTHHIERFAIFASARSYLNDFPELDFSARETLAQLADIQTRSNLLIMLGIR